MKYETYNEYDPKAMALAVPGLLTVWAGIQRFSDELVLVGGLVPHFICSHPTSTQRFPRPGTLDVDIGIALGASSGQYGSLQTDLQAQGFRLKDGRFEKTVGVYKLYVDFLVEDTRGNRGTVTVDDVPANVLPGIERALATARKASVAGVDLFGAKQDFTIPICEVVRSLPSNCAPLRTARHLRTHSISSTRPSTTMVAPTRRSPRSGRKPRPGIPRRPTPSRV